MAKISIICFNTIFGPRKARHCLAYTVRLWNYSYRCQQIYRTFKEMKTTRNFANQNWFRCCHIARHSIWNGLEWKNFNGGYTHCVHVSFFEQKIFLKWRRSITYLCWNRFVKAISIMFPERKCFEKGFGMLPNAKPMFMSWQRSMFNIVLKWWQKRKPWSERVCWLLYNPGLTHVCSGLWFYLHTF